MSRYASPQISVSAGTDPAFAALPQHIQKRIDRAFDDAASSRSAGFVSEFQQGSSKAAESRNAGALPPGGFLTDDIAPGGFVLEDDSGALAAAGGFMRDASEDDRVPLQDGPAHIPLLLIPAALQLLDLAPDDDDVLAVFRNAASGWRDAPHGPLDQAGGNADEQLGVARQDWRAVCAALLDTADTGASEEDIAGEDDADPGEAYVDSGQDESLSDLSTPESSDDDYREGGLVARKSSAKAKASADGTSASRRGSRKTSVEQDAPNPDRPRALTARQRDECRRAFGLFFPDVDDAALDKQRMKIKDVARAAALLKERLSAEEIVEMLDAFSSSADKSMGLQDFERMMIAARLA